MLKVNPVLKDIVSSIIVTRPDNVLDFMKKRLEDIEKNGLKNVELPPAAPVDVISTSEIS